MHQNKEKFRSRGLLSAFAALASWGWPQNIAPNITLGNRHASKELRIADADRRKRANKRLRRAGGNPSQRGRQRAKVNPSGTKAVNKALSGQLGVTRRGY